jgi:hypothetical protein
LRTRSTTNEIGADDVFSVRSGLSPERFLPACILRAIKGQETSLARMPQDKDRIERATREAKSIITIEREAREAKTARLRELRLSSETPASPGAAKRKPGAGKATRKAIELE